MTTKERIERAVFDADYGHSDPFATTIQERCAVAAKTALLIAKERIKVMVDADLMAPDDGGDALAILDQLLAEFTVPKSSL